MSKFSGVLLALVGAVAGTAADAAEVEDFIATSRVLSARLANDSFGHDGGHQVFISPNGKRYALLVVRTDIARNGNWLEVLTGSLTSLSAVARVRTAARLFTDSFGSQTGYGASALTLPNFNTVGWLDDSELAFLWEGGQQKAIGIMSVDLDTGVVRRRTDEGMDVTRFDVGPNGVLIYAMAIPQRNPESSERILQEGFAVESEDGATVLFGEFKGQVAAMGPIRRVVVRGENAIPVVAANGQSESQSDGWFSAAFDPKGERAVIDWAVEHPPADWRGYTDATFRKRLGLQERRAYGGASSIWQLYVADLRNGMARPLWDAPLSLRARVDWSPDGQWLVVGPTFLPLRRASSPAARSGDAIAIVDPRTGDFTELASNFTHAVSDVRWEGDTVEVVLDGGESARFCRRLGKWVRDVGKPPTQRRQARSPIHIAVQEDINTPPRVVAIDPETGQSRLVLDPNPQLTKADLGEVQEISWTDTQGTVWEGALYYPTTYREGALYPLVIQTAVRPEKKGMFSLFGGGRVGLGASYGPYAAQALASRGIFVLQLHEKRGLKVAVTLQEAETYRLAYESAAEHLVRQGLVMRDKVGLVGFSRSGWYVEHTLVRSSFPFAAAVVADNFDAGYLQAAFGGWRGESSMIHGAEPFGEGLRKWLESAPAFNADRINTPLQVQVHSGGLPGVLVTGWEMFSRLRHLGKPTELYVVPHIQHGSHGLQNPAQCIAAQKRAVDWFDFWLNSGIQEGTNKMQRYTEWRRLRRPKSSGTTLCAPQQQSGGRDVRCTASNHARRSQAATLHDQSSPTAVTMLQQ